MRRTPFLFVSLVLVVVFAACIQRREVKPSQEYMDRLVIWMTGSFSSQEQSQLDTDFFDIRLQMVQIWPERTDGRWLYVEQASALTLERPYRQRIYRLFRRSDTTFVSAVYEFEEPLRLAGAWRTPTSFDFLIPDSLEAMPGCAILLHPRGDSAFVGSTVDQECRSDHRGAAYASSEVRITELGMYTWDRGWDTAGVQVWGAVKGGYIFKKLREP